MISSITEFFNHPFFIWLGGITAIISIVIICYGVYIILKGVTPVWIRLGRGLYKRKIAIYATSDYNNLKTVLTDSGLFKEKNIEQIDLNSIERGQKFNICLLSYPDFSVHLMQILNGMKSSDAMIVFAPQTRGLITPEHLALLDSNRHCIVVNFKGRLLNDILTTLITTIYEKK